MSLRNKGNDPYELDPGDSPLADAPSGGASASGESLVQIFHARIAEKLMPAIAGRAE